MIMGLFRIREAISDIRTMGQWSFAKGIRNGIGTFPSDADDLQPRVVFNDKLFSDDVLANTSVSVHEEGVPLVPPSY